MGDVIKFEPFRNHKGHIKMGGVMFAVLKAGKLSSKVFALDAARDHENIMNLVYSGDFSCAELSISGLKSKTEAILAQLDESGYGRIDYAYPPSALD